MGHGTYHAGQQRYLDFEACIREQDPLLLMGLLMGEPGLSFLIQRLRQTGVVTVWLLPFMAVSGHHVRKDVFGDHAGSWQNMLQKAGFRVHSDFSGTLESPLLPGHVAEPSGPGREQPARRFSIMITLIEKMALPVKAYVDGKRLNINDFASTDSDIRHFTLARSRSR